MKENNSVKERQIDPMPNPWADDEEKIEEKNNESNQFNLLAKIPLLPCKGRERLVLAVNNPLLALFLPREEQLILAVMCPEFAFLADKKFDKKDDVPKKTEEINEKNGNKIVINKQEGSTDVKPENNPGKYKENEKTPLISQNNNNMFKNTGKEKKNSKQSKCNCCKIL